MPITYEMTGLWNLMNYEQTVAFFDALVEIYELDLSDDPRQDVFKVFNFGIYSGSGKPLTKFSLDPNAYFRILLEGGLAILGQKDAGSNETPPADDENDERRLNDAADTCKLGKKAVLTVYDPSNGSGWWSWKGIPRDESWCVRSCRHKSERNYGGIQVTPLWGKQLI
jgi:hypothetical protein